MLPFLGYNLNPTRNIRCSIQGKQFVSLSPATRFYLFSFRVKVSTLLCGSITRCRFFQSSTCMCLCVCVCYLKRRTERRDRNKNKKRNPTAVEHVSVQVAPSCSVDASRYRLVPARLVSDCSMWTWIVLLLTDTNRGQLIVDNSRLI